MTTRREFLAVAGAAAAEAGADGVRIGVQSNSFSDRGLEAAIEAMGVLGIKDCELWQGHVEPKLPAAEMLQWRAEAPAGYFAQIARRFREAGIRVTAYDFQFHEEFTDCEIERGLEIGHALGVKCMVTSSATLRLARRMAPFLEKHRMPVGMHGRTNVKDANQFAGPASFTAALGYSRYLGINLDLGHFTAAGFDAVPFVEAHHGRILSIHLKDRRRQEGPSVAFGTGDTPIRECLALLRRKGWRIPAHIEHDRGGDRVAGVRAGLEYCRRALAEA